jgi:hypothetical protein
MNSGIDQIFENQPDIIPPKVVASILSMSCETIYEWKARPHKYGTPPDLFIKIGRKLYLRRETLKTWVISRCA